MLRRQLPVYSPVTWKAIRAGFLAAVRGDGSGQLRERLAGLLKSRFDARDVLLTDSGTSALRLAIAGAVADSTRLVALPGYGCYDLATALEGAGARGAFYDLNPETLSPDPSSLESLRALRPVAVVVAHLFGYPIDLRALSALPGVLLIEDAAQAAGGRLDGRPLGSFGSLSVLSFGRGKGMTGGGGGALLAHDDRGEAIVASLRRHIPASPQRRGFHGLVLLAAQFVLGRPSLYAVPAALPFLHLGETVYHPPRTPRRASIASLATLERVVAESDRETTIRRANATRLLASLRRSGRFGAIEEIAGAEPGYLRLPALWRTSSEDRTLTAAVGRLGITPMYPVTLAALPGLSGLVTGPPTGLHGARSLAERLISLPTHRHLHELDLTAIEEWLLGR